MVFSSVAFLFAFLPVVLGTYAFARTTRARNAVLLGASLVFYAVGSGRFVLVLVATTLIDWLLSLGIGRAVSDGRRDARRVLVAASVGVNLGLLGWFKYANFGVDELVNPLLAVLGGPGLRLAEIALPVGISFFTFQRLSYVIDVARGDRPPLGNPVRLLVFVALFPQLIAGPIVRYGEIADQLRDRRHGLESFSAGAVRFVHGLAKKVIVADAVARVADAGFGLGPGELTFAAAWLATFAYALQIYFDFSGYSDMAIGLGLMFGFRFPENFARPYSALSVTDFWRRWHITLSTWFRDYLYVPLGGSHGDRRRTYRNLAIVFLATGIWHGAAWTFVLWGAYHGVLLALERATGQRAVDPATTSAVPLRRLLTFVAVLFGWVLFRADSLTHATAVVATMLQPDTAGLPLDVAAVLDRRVVLTLLLGAGTLLLPGHVVGGVALTRPILDARAGGRLLDLPSPRRQVVVAWQTATLTVVLGYAIVLAVSETFSPFLYFRF